MLFIDDDDTALPGCRCDDDVVLLVVIARRSRCDVEDDDDDVEVDRTLPVVSGRRVADVY